MNCIPKHLFLFLLFALLNCFSQLSASIDLEEKTQDFIQETKQIVIPGYPDAFNPSIIRWKGSLLMSFRIVPHTYLPFFSQLGLVWLDEAFNVISVPQLLAFNDATPLSPSRTDDGRLVAVNDTLYLVYSNNNDTYITAGGFRLFIAELIEENNYFTVHNPEKIARYDGEIPGRREKNWVPFNYDGRLMLAYSLNPHLIFHPIRGTGSCETITTSKGDMDWKWGELRGGTPALLHEGEYFGFFHTFIRMESVHSDGRIMPHYFMGAYTFQKAPPFAITRISPEPIIGKSFYHGPKHSPYWGSVRVIFPGGYIYDDNFVWVSYGRQDHECWIVKMDKKQLLKSLVPVNQVVD